jgi:hypothetical protein
MSMYSFEGTLNERVAVPIEVGKDAVFVTQSTIGLFSLGRESEHSLDNSSDHERLIIISNEQGKNTGEV